MAEKPTAQELLDEQLPIKVLAHIPGALQTAYEAVDALVDEVEWLRAASAQPGHLRAWAAEFQMKRLCDSGKLPFDSSWKPYKRQTGSWLRIIMPKAVLSVHQVTDAAKLPRRADYRDNGFLANQMLFDLADFRAEAEVRARPHLILTHGYQTLTFAHVGVPDVSGARYFARTPNLLTGVYVVESELPPTEGSSIEPEVKLKKSKPDEIGEFKEEFIRLLKDKK